MDEDKGQYLTGNGIADGFLGFFAAHFAITALWWVGFGISLPIVKLFERDLTGVQIISGFFAAPAIAWILAMLLVRPIKRKYQTLGRVYQATLIGLGVLYFGGLGICLVLMGTHR